ncbi:DUF11 domain-containing protein (plasmid) [Deinococcus metallilatus]|uniref:DUF11 domain-containing protein n=1 Tax=Deinococcus metallilatus TaxID=1211322 RepID=A0AAJ5F6P8_9DEIO|nr:DUF11 domain-containing protein [Deinococcus metallilatus]MBB5297370.1 putative repeat protein (TIGR01451 family) [Deinococcus metallilatus]QBY06935.1 DUF11 domain-containing protein [Deinococcus metallilatus]TLK32325.1 DUF11 domain-containing protein [Deinococcus metallilatus]GMA17075.1 hypothetical protein GCM10025871_34060 [Deinococcus metallilatus]
MKTVRKTIALLAALSLASAYAAGTTAGAAIGNQATASFSDASGTNPTTVYSNAVVTTVSAVPSFTVLLNNQNSSGTPGTNGAGLTPAGTASLVPGQQASFKYTITNTGNVTQDTYSFVTQTTYSATSGAAPTTPVYYTTDSSGNCTATAATTSGPLDPGQSATFCVVYTVPTSAKTGDKLGTNAIVALTPHTITSQSYTAPDGTVVPGAAVTETAPANDTDNWNQAQITRTDTGQVGPNLDADADGKVDPGNAVAVTSYQSPDGTPVTINYSGDSQNAQAISTTTSVTFLNTVKNNGNRADIFNLSTATAGFPTGTTVTITDTSGTTIANTGSLAAGAEYTFRVKVTFPANSAPASSGVAPTVTVTSTSQNSLPANGGAGAQTDTTTDIVNLPGVLFTDSVNGTPTPSAVSKTVTTTGATTGTTPVTFPMVVVNNGSTPDTFNLTGTVAVSIPTGNANPAVTYYADANCDGVADNTTALTSTGSLAAGAKSCFVASVAVPQNTLPGPYTVTQTATSPTTGTTSTDADDKFTVATTQNLYTPTKTVDKNTAAPGATLTYTITGSNTNNSNITKYILSDTVPTNTSFVSVTASMLDANNYGFPAGAKLMYRFNGGTWQPSATPTTVPTAGQKVEVAIDVNNDNTIDTNDILKPGQGISETFKVTVN